MKYTDIFLLSYICRAIAESLINRDDVSCVATATLYTE